MAFTLPPLPYEPAALEPTIDAQTMTIHHDKHHNTYVTNLNAAVQGTEFENMEIGELIANLDRVPAEKRTAVRNNGGGHWNHSMFWQIMGPGGGGAPTGEVAQAIDQAFGSFDAMKEQVNKAGAGRFGSGWAWVIIGADGALAVTSTPNQDNPLMTGVAEQTGTPILGVDVWEHAYYLKYQNRRPDYLAAWWDAVNWDAVNERFRQARG
ncbi:MAG: Superoxide dismutase [Mn] [uncultured Thermomicrobiales bacterium]|jgi:Fe-Mn family superoxide dismutase|uniref:Superoxide dismutase n=1 Tax=uncultured Thermomicrobiales bacterium TaxID=1645740 RepID=A0A6J4VKD4_9BACT|nr:MAG: Superoxide dismutase [Mn] [uncultured Thermomicrobiales bacterium]